MVGKLGLIISVFAGTLLGAPVTSNPQAQTTQGNPPSMPRFKTEIMVTPERGETPRHLVPASTVVLEAESLAALPAVQLSEISAFLPGFQFQQAQPYSVRPIVSARGFFGGGEAEYVLLLVDGVPVADAESGLIDWSLVPISSVRRIEALRGPGASMYGDSAIGGVIQILTDRPANGGALTIGGGSFATFTADGFYGRRSSSLGFVVKGAALGTDGASAHSAGKHFVVSGSVDGQTHGALWSLTVTGNDRGRDDSGALSADALLRDPFGSDSLFRFDRLDRRSLSTAFALSGVGERWQHRARVHTTARSEDLVRTILLAPGLGDRGARALSTSALGGSGESERVISGTKRSATVRFGLDVSREHLDTSYRAVSDTGVQGAPGGEASGRRMRTGAFMSSAWDPASRLRLSASLRWDRIADDFGAGSAGSRSHKAWSPRVGATLLLNENDSVSLFAQASRAFKAPTLDQLFDPRPFPDFMGGTFTISNPRLVPQHATNVEVGVSGGSRLRLSALVYRMEVDDEIDFDVRTFSYANIGRSHHMGVELEAGGVSWKGIQPSMTYALVRVTDPDGDRQLKNVPRHVITASAGFDLPWGLAPLVRYRRTLGAYLDDENVYSIDGPSTLEMRVRRHFGRHLVFLDVLNLTDDRYQEYGFTLADFSGRAVPYAYPGAPRAVRAGVIASF